MRSHSIDEAFQKLSNRLWKTNWCVYIGESRGKPCLILAGIGAPPGRRTRKMRTWMGYEVVVDTGQKTLFENSYGSKHES